MHEKTGGLGVLGRVIAKLAYYRLTLQIIEFYFTLSFQTHEYANFLVGLPGKFFRIFL